MDLTYPAATTGFATTLREALLAGQDAKMLRRKKKYASLMEAMVDRMGGQMTAREILSRPDLFGGAEGT